MRKRRRKRAASASMPDSPIGFDPSSLVRRFHLKEGLSKRRVVETRGRSSRRIGDTEIEDVKLGRSFAVPILKSKWNRPPSG